MDRYYAWQMVRDGVSGAFRFEKIEGPLPEPGPEEALVEVAACGVCGTDVSYYFGEVATVAEPPLTLGHEVSGRVVRGGGLEGKAVVVPTVVPCRKCELCRSGRANRCVKQRMYGGNFGTRGGFASHILVPAGELTPVPEGSPVPLERMAVVADAVSTPYQAVRRAGVKPGDKVIVIGATGGLGVYITQWAKRLGAGIVVGVARDEERLAALAPYGLDAAVPTGGRGAEEIRHDIWRACKGSGTNPRWGWTIFEASGTIQGQELGLELLTFASRLVLVGYAAGEVTHALSKVMAYDAEILGSWGCDPRHYADVIRHVVEGGIAIEPFTQLRPMSRIAESFDEQHRRRTDMRRIVLTADWERPGH